MDQLAFLRRFRLSGPHALLWLAAAVGLATAMGALAFRWLIHYFNQLFFGFTDDILRGFFVNQASHWWLPLIPMAGGLLVGPIVFKFAKEAKGHGVPEVMNAVARLGGVIRPRVAIAKTVASAICLGSGGSAGREGPIVQIGSALGSTLGQFLKLSEDRVKILVGCGAAAGISAVFNAPIAGVLFSVEVILGDLTISTFSPVLVSSVVASVVTRGFLGDNPAFHMPEYSLVSGWEIVWYAVLAVLLGVVAVTFTRTLDVAEDFFEKLSITPWLKPAIGGLLLGIIALAFPQVLADGYETIGLSLRVEMSLWILSVLVLLKIVATSLTLGSGNSGGIFAPSLFIGAMAGGAFGTIVHGLFPDWVAAPGAYALVGMAGLVAGTTHAPITAVLIIFEMTGDYRIILPLMVTVAISSLVARGLFGQSIYTIKLHKRGIDIKSGRDLNVLKSHYAGELLNIDVMSLAPTLTVAQAIDQMTANRQTEILVVDQSEHLLGMVFLSELQGVPESETTTPLNESKHLIHSDIETVFADTSLDQVLYTFNLRGRDILPVVRNAESRILVGCIHKSKLLEMYNQLLLQHFRR